MDFLPKEIEDIIIDYKYQFEYEDNRDKLLFNELVQTVKNRNVTYEYRYYKEQITELPSLKNGYNILEWKKNGRFSCAQEKYLGRYVNNHYGVWDEILDRREIRQRIEENRMRTDELFARLDMW